MVFLVPYSPMEKPILKTLNNGLRLQIIPMPGVQTVTTLVLAKAGSRYERWEESGLAHFLEHLFFKGSKNYPTAQALSMAVDQFGGAFNAFTGKEYAGYYVKTSAKFLPQSLDILSDMLGSPRLDSAEIDKERSVILEEMAMYLDAPMYQISWDFERLVFGDQPLGWDQIGRSEVIKSLQRAAFLEYYESLYSTDQVVITLAGDVTEKDLELASKKFFFPRKIAQRAAPAFTEQPLEKRFMARYKKTEQCHISLGSLALAEEDPQFPTLKVLANVLGGNMSSRLFQRLREKNGWCYSVRMTVDEYSDTGLVNTSAGIQQEKVNAAVKAIIEEYQKVIAEGISAEECQRAIAYLQGKIDLSTEDTENVAHHYGKNQLLYGHSQSLAEVQAAIATVEPAAVQRLAEKLLSPSKLCLAAIGPESLLKDTEEVFYQETAA